MDMRNQFQSKHSKHVAYDQTTKCYYNRNIDMKVIMPDLGNVRSVQMQVWHDFKKKWVETRVSYCKKNFLIEIVP